MNNLYKKISKASKLAAMTGLASLAFVVGSSECKGLGSAPNPQYIPKYDERVLTKEEERERSLDFKLLLGASIFYLGPILVSKFYEVTDYLEGDHRQP